MQVNNPMVKAKEADVLCSEKIMKKSEYLVYVVEAQSSTPSVPYGDAFSPITRYCITWLSKTSCRLVITCGIKFFKVGPFFIIIDMPPIINSSQNPLVKGDNRERLEARKF
ncbi:hypothetical protein DFS34DRAFT_372090 [Phlyctochytrium arcticum]|nr:hypothetical protein DFS34DRAFT_372090 [Phlyctochytrium arcticum]